MHVASFVKIARFLKYITNFDAGVRSNLVMSDQERVRNAFGQFQNMAINDVASVPKLFQDLFQKMIQPHEINFIVEKPPPASLNERQKHILNQMSEFWAKSANSGADRGRAAQAQSGAAGGAASEGRAQTAVDALNAVISDPSDATRRNAQLARQIAEIYDNYWIFLYAEIEIRGEGLGAPVQYIDTALDPQRSIGRRRTQGRLLRAEHVDRIAAELTKLLTGPHRDVTLSIIDAACKTADGKYVGFRHKHGLRIEMHSNTYLPDVVNLKFVSQRDHQLTQWGDVHWNGSLVTNAERKAVNDFVNLFTRVFNTCKLLYRQQKLYERNQDPLPPDNIFKTGFSAVEEPNDVMRILVYRYINWQKRGFEYIETRDGIFSAYWNLERHQFKTSMIMDEKSFVVTRLIQDEIIALILHMCTDKMLEDLCKNSRFDKVYSVDGNKAYFCGVAMIPQCNRIHFLSNMFSLFNFDPPASAVCPRWNNNSALSVSAQERSRLHEDFTNEIMKSVYASAANWRGAEARLLHGMAHGRRYVDIFKTIEWNGRQALGKVPPAQVSQPPILPNLLVITPPINRAPDGIQCIVNIYLPLQTKLGRWMSATNLPQIGAKGKSILTQFQRFVRLLDGNNAVKSIPISEIVVQIVNVADYNDSKPRFHICCPQKVYEGITRFWQEREKQSSGSIPFEPAIRINMLPIFFSDSEFKEICKCKSSDVDIAYVKTGETNYFSHLSNYYKNPKDTIFICRVMTERPGEAAGGGIGRAAGGAAGPRPSGDEQAAAAGLLQLRQNPNPDSNDEPQITRVTHVNDPVASYDFTDEENPTKKQRVGSAAQLNSYMLNLKL